jgi:TatD DNase family protein
LKLPNVYFSFSGNITYPKPVERAEKLAEAVRMIPLDKIMLDSDSPFLAPQEFRGKRNEPIFIKYIAKKIAEIKEINEGEVEKVTDENARKFFGI